MHPHHVRSRPEGAAAGLERGAGPLHLHAARPQDAQQARERQRILLLRRENEREGRLQIARPAVHPQERAQPVLAVSGGVIQDGPGGGELIVHDVGEAPGPARPGCGEVPGRRPRVVAEAGHEPVAPKLHRRGEIGGSRLRQDPHAAVRVRVGPGRAPGIEDRLGHDAGPALGHEPRRHRAAERSHRGAQGGVHVRLPGVEVGRDEHARAAPRHLMHVVDDLGPEAVVHVAHGELGLRLREHVPVAVVVVTGVLLVEHGRRRALVGGAHVLALPGGDEVGAVRVVRGDQQEHRLLEDPQHLGLVAARQAVREEEGRQRASHLDGVDRVVHRDDDLAAVQYPLRLLRGESARVVRAAGCRGGSPRAGPGSPPM